MIITIVGPTGVGKTKLSIELAKKFDAEIINGDSMQVYRNLNIGTAKPTEKEKENIIHHLFDIADVNTNYTVFDYQRDCRNKIEEIRNKGKNVIIVGGTGLYIKAALFDYQFTSGTTYKDYADLSNEEIYKKIKTYDNNIDIHINNRKRLVRTLNKIENNEPITNNKNKLLYDTIFIGLTTDRNTLYDRINKRVDKMFSSGLIEEVEKQKDNYKTSKALNSGIGYKEFYNYFYENKTLEEVKEEIKHNSRKYAKRQYTFFNNQFDVKWFEVSFEDFRNTINKIIEYVGDKYDK
ncbi:MAG: tRNA (adenosine(37)-N6)-dimethylallyltransferase MiaA [Bacilli bacterium]|nr:tRNA (adenosine(37)-N6)-dimethylallyltransferase MiaA [Bacilli bacterium]